MKYRPLFDLRLRHAFYDDGRCSDFSLEPTRTTRQLLKNHRSVLRPLPDGVRFVTPVGDDGKAFIPVEQGTKLAFDMRVVNVDFALFTDPEGVKVSEAPLYTNVALTPPESAELNLTGLEARFREALRVTEPGPGERFVLGGKPLAGLTAAGFVIETGGAALQVGGYDERAKRITVNTESTSPGQRFTVEYPVRPDLGRGVFARIEVHANHTLPNLETPVEQPREFRVAFRAKRSRWVYYCVTDLTHDVAAFRIVHASPSDDEPALAFGDRNRRDLTDNPDPADRVAGELAERYPELRVLRFVSNELVVCRQAPRKGLELQVNGGRLPGVLPNPSLRSFSTIQVRDGRRLQQQDTLLEIIKVLGHNGV